MGIYSDYGVLFRHQLHCRKDSKPVPAFFRDSVIDYGAYRVTFPVWMNLLSANAFCRMNPAVEETYRDFDQMDRPSADQLNVDEQDFDLANLAVVEIYQDFGQTDHS